MQTPTRLCVLMMAYNNDKFIRAALEPLIESDYVDQIVVVEGAWSPNTESQRSEDDTLAILHELEQDTDKLDVIYWEQMPIEMYRGYQCEWHEELVRLSNEHPYYDGPALQQQLLARDWGLRRIMNDTVHKHWADSSSLVPGWLWIVDSDEVYLKEQIDELVDFLDIAGEDHDFFTIQGKNFYFNGKQYHDEWYRRLFRLQLKCFFSDDNSLEVPGAKYLRTMNIPPEVIEFFHYGYVGEFRVKKKLEMWRQDAVSTWWKKHKHMMANEEEYGNSPVHLFGDMNPGYRNYTLRSFKGEHPKSVRGIYEIRA